MLLGPTMRVKEEKPNELRLDATRRRRSSWCEDGARIVRVVWSVLEGLCPRPVLERLIHALEIMKSERAIVSRIGSVTLVHERQIQHEVGQATAAVELVDHFDVTPTLASTGGDLGLRPDRVAQK
jgi:hypothetical protein